MRKTKRQKRQSPGKLIRYSRKGSSSAGAAVKLCLMGMRPPCPTHSARAGYTGARRRFTATWAGGGKDGEFLAELERAAVRTFRPLPISRTHKNLAVALALFTMKFVNRHESIIATAPKTSSFGVRRQAKRDAALAQIFPPARALTASSPLPRNRISMRVVFICLLAALSMLSFQTAA